MNKFKQNVLKLIIKIRYMLLGFGLAGLHYDDFVPGVIFVSITTFALVLIFEETKWSK